MEELFGPIALGDHRAFTVLYRRARGLVFRTVFDVLGDHAQAEEVVQEVFLELWQTASRYQEGRGAARHWVVTIARRRAVDRVRSAQAARRRDDQQARVWAAEWHPDPVDEVMLALDAQRLRAAMAELGREQRELLVSAYLRGLSHSELARRMDVPLGTVKSRIRLAAASLRRVFDDSQDRQV